MGIVGLQWAAYATNSREYDACVERVERSAANRKFNDTLIAIIRRELADRPDIADDLSAAELPKLSIDTCGNKPTFLNATRSQK